MLASRSRSLLPLPLIAALVGLAFAIWNAWDAASVPCLSAGCTLYQTFTINGFSLWWGGAAAFGLLAVLAITGRGGNGRFLAGLCVALDCILLVIMLLTLPCFACMIAALLLAVCYAAFRQAVNGQRYMGQTSTGRGFSRLLLVWGLCFVMLLGLSLNSTVAPWPVRGADSDEAAVHIYFSPSCSACRQLVSSMPDAESAKAVWYPVAEDEADLPVILALKRRLEQGNEPIRVALAASFDAAPLSFFEFFSPETLLLRFRLWCNQARVIDSGEGQLPFVEFRGLPQALIRQPAANTARSGQAARPIPAPASSSQRINNDATLPIDLGDAGSCGGASTKPCP